MLREEDDVNEAKIKLPMFECLRCGHRWYPKKPEQPKCCGFCKSPYWNVPSKDASRARRRHTNLCGNCRA